MKVTPHYILVNGENVSTQSSFDDAYETANQLVNDHTNSVIIVADGRVVWEYEA